MNSNSNLMDFEYESVSVDERGQIVERQSHWGQQYIEVLSADSRLEMVTLPTGGFMMGSRPGSGESDEQPQHSVWVRQFFLSKHPITQEQWRAVMDWSPLFRYKGDKRPADRISWKAALEFCERLSRLTGRAYRLPSEAEWEYACRAGTSTTFSCGNTITTDLANYVGLVPYLSEAAGLNRHETTESGAFPPNAFGVCDMHGNVWEWCADAWHDSYSGAPADANPWEGDAGSPRVLRGGCWHDPPVLCRSAVRLFHAPGEGEDFFGFRVALSSLQPATGQSLSGRESRPLHFIRRKLRDLLSKR